jgi:hypothetical protein
MGNFSHSVALGQNFWTTSVTPVAALGARQETDDGRVYRYARVGAVAITPGTVLQGPAIVTNHLGMVSPAVPAGARSFSCTPGATLGTENQYAGGYLQVDDGAGAGHTYGVNSHAAFASGTAFQLNLDDPILVALTTASRLGLHANPYNGVIIVPQTTATGIIAGVAPYAMAIGTYGWIQTWGPCAVLINGTPALGAAVLGVSGTTAGSVDIATAAPLIVSQPIGFMMQIGVSAKFNMVWLHIAP